MKRMISLVVGALVMGTMAFGQVYSQNAVGYVKKTINPGEFAYIQNPFVKIDGSGDFTVSEMLPDVPNGTTVLTWDTANQAYVGTTKNFLGAWPQDPAIARGEAFFVQISAAAPSPVDIYLLGEVPGNTTYASTDIPLVEGFTAVGVPYPVATTIEDSGLNAALPNNSSILLWDVNTQGYLGVTKNFLGAWAPANTMIEPGDGFFVSLPDPAGATYTEVPGYDYPDN